MNLSLRLKIFALNVISCRNVLWPQTTTTLRMFFSKRHYYEEGTELIVLGDGLPLPNAYRDSHIGRSVLGATRDSGVAYFAWCVEPR